MNNDIKITITCCEEQDTTTAINVLAEQNYAPIFKEVFVSSEKPLSPRLIDRKIISEETIGKPGSEQILSSVLQSIRAGIKIDGKAFTQNENDLKSLITDFPIIEKFQKIIGIEFDWSKFHNRREFREYFRKTFLI
jgi:hypothetical protein